MTAAACDAPSARPLAGAQVIVRCADRPAPIVTATTDEHGRFDADPEHPIPLECTFEVSRDGYVTRTFPVSEACAVTAARTCALAGLTVELQGGSSP